MPTVPLNGIICPSLVSRQPGKESIIFSHTKKALLARSKGERDGCRVDNQHHLSTTNIQFTQYSGGSIRSGHMQPHLV